MGKLTILLLSLIIHFHSCYSQTSYTCPPSSCGDLHNITFPFRLKTDPQNCGFPSSAFELSCENNQTVLSLYAGKYLVQAINYTDFTIRVVDASVNQNSCSSIPQYSLTGANFTSYDPYVWFTPYWNFDSKPAKLIVFMKCDNPVNSVKYVETAPCVNRSYSYVMDNFTSVADVENSCSVELMVVSRLPARVGENVSFREIHSDLVYGFVIWWNPISCETCRDGKEICRLPNGLNQPQCSDGPSFFRRLGDLLEGGRWFILMLIGAIIISRSICCTPFVVAFLGYTWSRRHKSMYDSIEEFLQNQNNLAPVRYSYSQIKKMTNGFKDKLGEGGYGSVYKAKLRSGRFAAVKMLGKSKANGQDFINEVGSIGQVHHVNVVQLVGFCAEGSRRALVYDFMPNGSLDKYVLSREGNIHLSWKQMHEISLGVARGIDYLHRGCEMQILHFDIKPHNILLDENFVPKVSDFGLAKLCATSDTTLTLTAARGTIGYIAPELFYKNIGGVSYKADVYSFGMLLLEMVGKKKNLNAETGHSSQTYFPNWVYNEVVDGKVAIKNAKDGEEKLVKKMVTVALWCIQMKPSDRPSMNKVLEMLEADSESLPVPPKPSLYTEEKPMRFEDDTDDETWSSSMLLDSSDSVSLLENSY
ncbi:rust resistance kinase Lr10-like [Euphorbia lathyris]|uniref:rust resistance kinase Lr10-like n=1 Tax=Euphorbia lathyris TaxID=212925 RepID=UPI003313A293